MVTLVSTLITLGTVVVRPGRPLKGVIMAGCMESLDFILPGSKHREIDNKQEATFVFKCSRRAHGKAICLTCAVHWKHKWLSALETIPL